jgi:SAM-dependent methyltransferase
MSGIARRPREPTVPLVCPEHRVPLTASPSAWDCARGCRFPIINGIPRFVADDGYAASFGLQWNRFRTIQLDSATGQPLSRRRLERLLGAPVSALNGRKVLEVGCGAGRFTEVLLSGRARVFACDLSRAVDAASETCGEKPGVFLCQADLQRLPVEREQFDVVICVGVLQHTPDPERSLEALSSHLKPGGMLVIDHYKRSNDPVSTARRIVRALYPKPLLRELLLRLPPKVAFELSRGISSALWPVHTLLWTWRSYPGIPPLRRALLRFSPVHDYHEAYPELDEPTLRGWAILDTHDDLTDHYKHVRSVDEIAAALSNLGLIRIDVAETEVVEARGFRRA